MPRQIARTQVGAEELEIVGKMLRIVIWNISGKRLEPEIAFANKVVKGKTFIRIEAILTEFEGEKDVHVTGMFHLDRQMSCEIQVGQTLKKSLIFDNATFLGGESSLHSAKQLKHSLEYL